jgi:UDP-N-acetyl-D-glucosamine dehydrogenase
MIESSMMINDNMPQYTVDRAGRILNRFGKAISRSRILILGVAYKQDISDYRESPAIVVIDLLKKAEAEVSFFDPHVPEYRFKGESFSSLDRVDEDIIAEYDLVIITAAHTSVDYAMVQASAKAVFDTKNAMKKIKTRDNIETL